MKKIYTIFFVSVLGCLMSCSEDFDQNEDKCVPNITRSISEVSWDDCVVCSHNGDEYRLPWANPSPTSIPTYIRTDVKQEDGWRVLFSSVEIVGSTVPYVPDKDNMVILLYNIYTGVLKGFCYLNNVLANNTAYWLLTVDDNSTLFNFADEFAIAQDDSSKSSIVLSNITGNIVTGGFEKGWNCFMTELAYDANSINQTLGISAYTLNETIYNFSGAFNSVSSGTIITGTNKAGSSIINGVASATGNVAKKWIVDNTGPQKAIRSKAVSSIIQNIASSSTVSLIKSGLNLVFSSILGGNQPNGISTLNFQTNGSVSLDGKSTTPQSGNGCVLSGIPLNGLGMPLGVWNLSSKPECVYDEYAELLEISPRPYSSDYECLYRMGVKPVIHFVNNPHVPANVTASVNMVEYAGTQYQWLDRIPGKKDMCNIVKFEGSSQREALYLDTITYIASMPDKYVVATAGMLPDRTSSDRDNRPVRDFQTGSWDARRNLAVKVTVSINTGGINYVSSKTFIPNNVYKPNITARPYKWTFAELDAKGY